MLKSAGEKLRELIEADEVAPVPGVFDGLSCLLVERAGFPAATISGAGLSNSRLGRPDVGLLSLADNLDSCRALVASVSIPLVADADTGYGNAVSTYFTTQAFEQVGVAGVQLEDQLWPKKCGHMRNKQVVSREEMAGKIRAAAEARQDPSFVIIGRTDAADTHNLDEAIARANLYLEAGADIVVADSLLDTEQVRAFASRVHGPVKVNMGDGIRKRPTAPWLSLPELQELGVALATYPGMLISASILGMQRVLEEFGTSVGAGLPPTDRPDLLVTWRERQEILNLDNIYAMEREYEVQGSERADKE